MPRRTTKGRTVAAKARQLLEFAEQRARQAADWVELHNALFGLGGTATALLTTESERTAFAQTAECKRIFALLDGLPPPAVKDFGELLATANGAISVRLRHFRVHHAQTLGSSDVNEVCVSTHESGERAERGTTQGHRELECVQCPQAAGEAVPHQQLLGVVEMGSGDRHDLPEAGDVGEEPTAGQVEVGGAD